MSNPWYTGGFICHSCPQLDGPQPIGGFPEPEEPRGKFMHRCGKPRADYDCASISTRNNICALVDAEGNLYKKRTEILNFYSNCGTTLRTRVREVVNGECVDAFEYLPVYRSGDSFYSTAVDTYADWYGGGTSWAEWAEDGICGGTLSITGSVTIKTTKSLTGEGCESDTVVSGSINWTITPNPIYDGEGNLICKSEGSGSATLDENGNITPEEHTYTETFGIMDVNDEGDFVQVGEGTIERTLSLNKGAPEISYEGPINVTLGLHTPTTEEAASYADEPVEDGYCSSIHEIRTDNLWWTERESKYTLSFQHLCLGKRYRACAQLARRKAFSGSVPEGEDTNWEFIEPDTFGPFQATASNTEDGVTIVEEATDIDLPMAEGWEYQISYAYVWPEGSPCKCPVDPAVLNNLP